MLRRQYGSATRNGMIVVLVMVVLIAIAVMMLPKGFSSDVSVIGKGVPVVVLMHDKNTVMSLDLMELLNRIRPDYAGRVEFIAVDVNSGEGQAFSRQQGVGGAMLIIFDGDGTRLEVLDHTVDEASLRADLDTL